MSYFDWRGNKQGKSIYDTKVPVTICLLLPVIIVVCLFFSGCFSHQLNQLAGRHTIRHPETKEKLWVPYSINPENWDSERKLWIDNNGEVCNDIYLYPERLNEKNP